MDNKLKIKESFIPPNRLSYKEWVKFAGINELKWLYDPSGKERADRIMERVGIPQEKTLIEVILNED